MWLLWWLLGCFCVLFFMVVFGFGLDSVCLGMFFMFVSCWSVMVWGGMLEVEVGVGGCEFSGEGCMVGMVVLLGSVFLFFFKFCGFGWWVLIGGSFGVCWLIVGWGWEGSVKGSSVILGGLLGCFILFVV